MVSVLLLIHLVRASINDRGHSVLVLGRTVPHADGLDGLDYVHRRLVSHLSKDNVLAIEPGSDNSGDEELASVAKACVSSSYETQRLMVD